MLTKNDALLRIEEIHKTLKNNFLVEIKGKLLLGIGLGLIAVPGCEWLMGRFIDDTLLDAGIARWGLFLIRTILYWVTFYGISKWAQPKTSMHTAVQQAWSFHDIYPIIPIATAGMLALTGNKAMIPPITQILVGCFWGTIACFSSRVISWVATVFIVTGIGGIYLTTLTIPHLWAYFLLFQGTVCTIAGMALFVEQRNHTRD